MYVLASSVIMRIVSHWRVGSNEQENKRPNDTACDENGSAPHDVGRMDKPTGSIDRDTGPHSTSTLAKILAHGRTSPLALTHVRPYCRLPRLSARCPSTTSTVALKAPMDGDPSSAADQRAHAVEKLRRAASLPRKDGRRPSIHANLKPVSNRGQAGQHQAESERNVILREAASTSSRRRRYRSRSRSRGSRDSKRKKSSPG